MDQYVLYLNVFVIFNLGLLIFSLLFKKKSQKSNYLLAVLIFLILNTAVNNLGVYYFQRLEFLFTQISFGGLNLVYGPVLLALISFLHETKLAKSWKWHFVPALSFFLYGLSYLFLSEETKKANFELLLAGDHVLVNILNFLIVLHTMVYMFGIRFQLMRFKRTGELSSIPNFEQKHRWAVDFVNYQIVAAFVMLFSYLISIFVFSKPTIFCDMVVGPCVSLCIYSFIVFKNFEFIGANENGSKAKGRTKEAKPQAIKDTMYSIQADELTQRLESHLLQTKSYTNPNISLYKLADELAMSPTLLSQTINQNYGITFSEYINQFRVENAKSLLASSDKQHLKIEAIGEMAGFNSNSTFFSVFKKQTGSTPSAFKNALSKP